MTFSREGGPDTDELRPGASHSRVCCKTARRLLLTLAAVTAVLHALQQSVAADSILTSGKKLYSQHNEELIIRDFFQDRKDGFFVDVGCYQWKDMSTTYYLEKHLGWSGIGIDALPWLAEGYEQNRPRTKFFNYIVTDHSGTTEPFHMFGAVSSTSKEWVEHFPFAKGKDVTTIEVPTITLNDLLERNGVSKIDFLSIDIEGGELRALAGFDIERFAPELVCIEGGRKRRKVITSYFDSHGYERIEKYLKHDRTNWYFKRKDPAPSR